MGDTQRANAAGPQAARSGQAPDGSMRGLEARRVPAPPQEPVASVPRFPPVELPVESSRLAAAAVDTLGWDGVRLPEMTLLGRHVVVVARMRVAAHAERLCFGAEPVVDRTTVATWVWPEFAHCAPPPAVDIVGVLGVARHWRTGLASVGPFARFCNAAVVVPWSVAMTQDYLSRCLPRARRYGVSVLTADPDGETNLDQSVQQAGVSHAGGDAESCVLTRWMNELVYQRLLDTLE